MCWGEGPSDDDVIYWTPKDLTEYFSSKACHDDYAATCPTNGFKSLKRTGSYDRIGGTMKDSGTNSMINPA
jgi:hypothetical protein